MPPAPKHKRVAKTKLVKEPGKSSDLNIAPVELSSSVTESPVAMGDLYGKVRAILDTSRYRAARSVNSEMVRAYWQIGQAIVEHEQAGKERADYGTHLIKSLAGNLKVDGFKGFHARNLWWMRDFYLTQVATYVGGL